MKSLYESLLDGEELLSKNTEVKSVLEWIYDYPLIMDNYAGRRQSSCFYNFINVEKAIKLHKKYVKHILHPRRNFDNNLRMFIEILLSQLPSPDIFSIESIDDKTMKMYSEILTNFINDNDLSNLKSDKLKPCMGVQIWKYNKNTLMISLWVNSCPKSQTEYLLKRDSYKSIGIQISL